MTSAAGNSILRVLLLFCIVLISGGGFQFRVEVLTALFLCGFIYYTNSVRFSLMTGRYRRIYILVVILLGQYLYHTYLNEEFSFIIVTRMVNVLLAYLMMLCYDNLEDSSRAFIRDFSVVGKVLIIHGLLSLLAVLLLPSWFQPLWAYGTLHPTIIHMGYLFYSCIYTDVNSFLSIIPRCMGLFWEPGVFQLYLNIFLFILLFCSSGKISKGWLFFVLVAIAAAQSVVGYMICFIQIVIWAIRKNLFLRIAACIILPFLVFFGYNLLEKKLMSDSSAEAGSFWIRKSDMLSGLQVAMDYPIAGIGFEPDDFILRRRLIDDEGLLSEDYTWDRGNTNGILMMCYSMGFPLALYFLWGLYRQPLLPNKRWLFFGIVCFSISTEPLALLAFPLMFVLYGMLPPKAPQLLSSLKDGEDS